MANINIRVDTEVKKEAQELFSALGIDMSTAVNIFLRQTIRNHGLPFEIKLDVPNKITMKAIEDVENNVNITGPFTSVASLMDDLNA